MTDNDPFQWERGAAETDNGPSEENATDGDDGPFEWPQAEAETDDRPRSGRVTDSDSRASNADATDSDSGLPDGVATGSDGPSDGPSNADAGDSDGGLTGGAATGNDGQGTDSDDGPVGRMLNAVARSDGLGGAGATDGTDSVGWMQKVVSAGSELTESVTTGTNDAESDTDLSESDITSPVLNSNADGNGDAGGELTVPEVERTRSVITGARNNPTDNAMVDPFGLGQLGEDVADLFLTGDSVKSVTELFLPGQSGASDVPRTARVVAESTWRLSDYSMQAQMRASRRIAEAVTTSQSPDELLTELLDIADAELEQAEAELQRQGVDLSDIRQRSEYSDGGSSHRADTPSAGEKHPATTDSMPDWVSSDGGTARAGPPATATGTEAPSTPPSPATNPDTLATPTATATDPNTPTTPASTATDPGTVDDARQRSTLDGLAESLPDISTSWVRKVASSAPLVFGAVRRVAEYSVQTQTRTARRLWRTATTADSPDALLDETLNAAIEEGERLGLDIEQDITDRIAGQRSVTSADPNDAARLLSERGSQLLHQSADTDADEEIHPAYAHILKQVSADEARILRLLATEGRQPAVDVRSKGLVMGSELVAESMSMIGIEAGCHAPDRASVYLENLERLRLARVADEPLDNLKRYQILEAQPDVAEAEEEAKRASMVYRSICLTPLGSDFCRVCFSVDADAEHVVGEKHTDDE